MYITPVSFTGETKYVCGQGASRRERYRNLDEELKRAYTLRCEGVDAPKYMAIPMPKKGQELHVKYVLDGDPANTKKNPINDLHLENLFTNFYRMEKAGLCYKTLGRNNIFYGKKGKVELGSLQKVEPFSLKENHNAKNPVFPSNADSYELNGLCYYVADFNDNNSQLNFVKKYLKHKSDYHQARADYLIKKGFSPISKEVLSEDIKSKVFKNPSDEVVEYTRDKLEFFALNRESKAMWERGDRAMKHKERCVAVVLMLEALRMSAKLNDTVQKLSKDSDNVDERLYFALEGEYLQAVEEEIFNNVQKCGDANFPGSKYAIKGSHLGSKSDREFFNDTMGKIELDAPISKTDKDISTLVDLYKGLIEGSLLQAN